MKQFRLFPLLFLVLFLLPVLPVLGQAAAPVRVMHITDAIDPMVAQYVERNLARTDASLYVIELDTPGGSDSSMRRVVQAILASPVPVAVYVAPDGARAGSAGVFITLAAHIAAMAPGTNIGAAHPVSSSGEDIPGTMGTKVANDAAAYARSIAELRGRNADWAEQAVRNSVSLPAGDAVAQHVVDLIAANLDDLLKQLDGRQITTSAGTVTLQVSTAPREDIPMTLLEQFLHVLINPNIAYALMSIGMLAIVIELFHPGAILPAVTGTICLILAFIGFENLPLNWGGVALLALGVVMFALDIKVTGFALSIGGAVAFVLGSLILFSPVSAGSPLQADVRVSPYVIAAMTVATAGLFLFAIAASWRAQKLPAKVNPRAVVGTRGVTVTELNPNGIVHAEGEEWSALAQDPPIPAGSAVEIVALEGLTVTVRRA